MAIVALVGGMLFAERRRAAAGGIIRQDSYSTNNNSGTPRRRQMIGNEDVSVYDLDSIVEEEVRSLAKRQHNEEMNMLDALAKKSVSQSASREKLEGPPLTSMREATRSGDNYCVSCIFLHLFC